MAQKVAFPYLICRAVIRLDD
eukprot:COSAG06_NODE_48996_length_328_cov_0.903930_1_plen_20_part_10